MVGRYFLKLTKKKQFLRVNEYCKQYAIKMYGALSVKKMVYKFTYFYKIKY